jgi:hypothetical protein
VIICIGETADSRTLAGRVREISRITEMEAAEAAVCIECNDAGTPVVLCFQRVHGWKFYRRQLCMRRGVGRD